MTTTEQAVPQAQSPGVGSSKFTEAELQQKAKDHLWMHFSRQSVMEEGGGVPIIVKGEGHHIWDSKGKKYFDGLSGLFVVNAGHGRRRLAEVAAKQAEELAFFPIWSYAHPGRHRARRSTRVLRSGRPEPSVLLNRRWRGR